MGSGSRGVGLGREADIPVSVVDQASGHHTTKMPPFGGGALRDTPGTWGRALQPRCILLGQLRRMRRWHTVTYSACPTGWSLCPRVALRIAAGRSRRPRPRRSSRRVGARRMVDWIAEARHCASDSGRDGEHAGGSAKAHEVSPLKFGEWPGEKSGKEGRIPESEVLRAHRSLTERIAPEMSPRFSRPGPEPFMDDSGLR
jgi:hypothetical protein